MSRVERLAQKRSQPRDGAPVSGTAQAPFTEILRKSDGATRLGLASWLQRSAGNRSLSNLVAQREPEERHMLHELHGGQAEREADSWDPMILSTFGKKTYSEYINTVLQSGTFFGQTVGNLHPDLINVLQKIETALRDSHGAGYKVPTIDSGFRSHKGMHGLGMAVDFDVIENPYVLNEEGETALDDDLKKAYDHIAQFMLGAPQSAVRNLTQGRQAFGSGSIADVYEALDKESGAMRRYFRLKDDPEALSDFLAKEWPATHPKQAPPDAAVIKAQMASDYEILGGKTAAGGKRPAPTGSDRPFAPVSSSGQGDPATGFLNLREEFVQAMTDAGLAWGAIDFGGASGDIQHFDLRLNGIGKTGYNALLARKAKNR